MNRRLFAILPLLFCGAEAQELGVGFPNGTSLKIRTQVGGAGYQVSSAGMVVVDANTVHRMVMDNSGKIVFAYDLEAHLVGHELTLRVKPLDQNYEQRLRRESWFPKGSPLDNNGRLYSFAKMREVPGVHAGDTVSLDLLSNPTTGDKITDLIQASLQSLNTPHQENAGADEFQLSRIRISIDGKPVTQDPATSASLTGAAAMIYLPGRGGYFFSREPVASYGFQRIGNVVGNQLLFTLGKELFMVMSEQPILKNAGASQVWVYHDPGYKPRGRAFDPFGKKSGDEIQVATASDVQSLLPR